MPLWSCGTTSPLFLSNTTNDAGSSAFFSTGSPVARSTRHGAHVCASRNSSS